VSSGRGGRDRIGDTTTSRTRGLREAEWEVTTQCEVRPRNSNVRQSVWQMGGASMRRGNATTSWTRGTGGYGMTSRQRCNDRQRRRQMGGSGARRGNATTSRTRGKQGNSMERGMIRGNSAMRGAGVGRWEVVQWVAT
jgi:hypothetical protein